MARREQEIAELRLSSHEFPSPFDSGVHELANNSILPGVQFRLHGCVVTTEQQDGEQQHTVEAHAEIVLKPTQQQLQSAEIEHGAVEQTFRYSVDADGLPHTVQVSKPLPLGGTVTSTVYPHIDARFPEPGHMQMFVTEPCCLHFTG